MTPDLSSRPAAFGGQQPRTLVIGYGNPDRQDDGVASHILDRLSGIYGKPVYTSPSELSAAGSGPVELLLQLQLIPELAEAFLEYNPVIFVDAHTGDNPDDISVKEVRANFQTSPLTHHMTPETLMALLHSLYQADVRGVLVSIRGYEFGFDHSLSAQTQILADKAIEIIVKLIDP